MRFLKVLMKFPRFLIEFSRYLIEFLRYLIGFLEVLHEVPVEDFQLKSRGSCRGFSIENSLEEPSRYSMFLMRFLKVLMKFPRFPIEFSRYLMEFLRYLNGFLEVLHEVPLMNFQLKIEFLLEVPLKGFN
jgi:intein-encoded DNA endonuclease-like protein